jgi:hypothetical protein
MDTALPLVDWSSPPEPFAASDLETGCDYPDEKPGTQALRSFVMQRLGGADFGITRPCDRGGKSEHKRGRAWDWGMRASDPDEAARAQALLDWLLASGPSGEPAEMFRRIGLMYVIWDGQVWSTLFKEWRPYTGADPHTGHVHFSLSWPGALGETSFFRWLRGDADRVPVPPPTPIPPPIPVRADTHWLALGLAAAAGYGLVRMALRRRGAR